METFNQFVTGLVLLVTAVKLPATISRWRMATRYYGRVRFPLARSLWTYALHSAHRFQLLSAIGLHGLIVMGEVRLLLKHDPYPRWLCIAVILWSWRLVADQVCPPIALIISSSNRPAIEERGMFAFCSPQYRLLSFMTPREHIVQLPFYAHFQDDLRVRRGTGSEPVKEN